MRYFVPDIRLPEESSSNIERFGGIPFGLATADWPLCAECGKSQSLLAQIAHHPDRLDLGRDGRTLFVFQCNHDPGMCDTWSATSGANACLVMEPEDLIEIPSPLPSDRPPLDNAVVIAGWIVREDSVSETEATGFYSDENFLELGEAVWRKVSTGTKLGSVPSWVQSPDEAPKGWRFIGQLDSAYSFLSMPDAARPWVKPDREAWEGRAAYADGPNFGGGIAYLFMAEGGSKPEVRMFWQCG